MMHKSIYTVLLFICICLVPRNSSAQTTEKEALAKLSFMIGNWKGTSTIYSDTTKRVPVTENVRYLIDGNLIVLDVKSSLIELHTVIRYDAKEQTYYYQPFSKSRGKSSYKGSIVNDDFIVYFSKERRLIFTTTAKGEFHEYGEKLVDGKWVKYFEDILQKSTNN